VNAIKIVLFVIVVSFFSGVHFSVFSMEDDSEDVFYENEWDESLVHLVDKKRWDQKTKRPTTKDISDAAESAIDAIKNEGRTKESITNELLTRLNSLFVLTDEYGKEKIHLKDLQIINFIKNEFEKALDNKIQEKNRLKEIKIQEKKVLKDKKEQDFDILLREVVSDFYGVPTKEWRDAVVDQALEQIKFNNNIDIIIEKINTAFNAYRQTLWLPFYKNSVDQVKKIIIAAIQNEVTDQNRKKEEAKQKERNRVEKVQQEQRDKFKTSMIDVHEELKTRHSKKEDERQKKEQEEKQLQELKQKRIKEERALKIQEQQEQYKNVMHQQLKSIHEKKEQEQQEIRRAELQKILAIEKDLQNDLNKVLLEAQQHRESIAKQEQERQERLQQEKIYEDRKELQREQIKTIMKVKARRQPRLLRQKAQIPESSFVLQQQIQQ